MLSVNVNFLFIFYFSTFLKSLSATNVTAPGTATPASLCHESGGTSSYSPPNLTVVVMEFANVEVNGTITSSLTLSRSLSLLVVNCSADYPIQWTFLHHPHFVQDQDGDKDLFSWNVSHFRMKDDVLDETGPETFSAILTFVNVSENLMRNVIRPRCMEVIGNRIEDDQQGCEEVAVGIPGLEGRQEKNGAFLNTSGIGASNCSLDLWFDEGPPGHFVCQSRDASLIPIMSFRYCANPTECGVSSRDECWEHWGHDPQHATHPKSCGGHNDRGTLCASLGVGTEFAIPKAISCLPKGNDTTRGHGGVKLLGYFHSLKVIDGHPASSYVSWDEADPADLISVTPSKSRLMANESFEVECSASSYYFAGGLHLTLKLVSGGRGGLYSEGHLQHTQENLEMWKNALPIRRTLVASNVLLLPGDYEITCYAPVWNSTQWASKSTLVSVSNTSNPVFITGNGTTTLEFVPHRNLSCLVKGIPPPTISWSYRTDRVKVVEVRGESKLMSWSIITLPENIDSSTTELEFTCRAENFAGFDEKLFLVTRNDEAFLMSTKIAALVVLLGFVANLIVFFFCWKKLFSESEEEDDEERKGLAGIKFLRDLWNGKISWSHCRKINNSMPSTSQEPCPHPNCRQKQTQT